MSRVTDGLTPPSALRGGVPESAHTLLSSCGVLTAGETWRSTVGQVVALLNAYASRQDYPLVENDRARLEAFRDMRDAEVARRTASQLVALPAQASVEPLRDLMAPLADHLSSQRLHGARLMVWASAIDALCTCSPEESEQDAADEEAACPLHTDPLCQAALVNPYGFVQSPDLLDVVRYLALLSNLFASARTEITVCRATRHYRRLPFLDREAKTAKRAALAAFEAYLDRETDAIARAREAVAETILLRLEIAFSGDFYSDHLLQFVANYLEDAHAERDLVLSVPAQRERDALTRTLFAALFDAAMQIGTPTQRAALQALCDQAESFDYALGSPIADSGVLLQPQPRLWPAWQAEALQYRAVHECVFSAGDRLAAAILFADLKRQATDVTHPIASIDFNRFDDLAVEMAQLRREATRIARLMAPPRGFFAFLGWCWIGRSGRAAYRDVVSQLDAYATRCRERIRACEETWVALITRTERDHAAQLVTCSEALSPHRPLSPVPEDIVSTCEAIGRQNAEAVSLYGRHTAAFANDNRHVVSLQRQSTHAALLAFVAKHVGRQAEAARDAVVLSSVNEGDRSAAYRALGLSLDRALLPRTSDAAFWEAIGHIERLSSGVFADEDGTPFSHDRLSHWATLLVGEAAANEVVIALTEHVIVPALVDVHTAGFALLGDISACVSTVDQERLNEVRPESWSKGLKSLSRFIDQPS